MTTRRSKQLLGSTLTLLVGFGALSVHGQVMQSSNYQIEFDSVNVAGGRATSTTFTLEDTVGEIGTGPSDSASYELRAGYQQMNETFVSLAPPGDVTLSPSVGGITGGSASGTTAFTVTTDSLAGYEVTIEASSSPALRHTATSTTIADYTPDGSDPDYDFTIDTTDSEFGFTPEGPDIAQRYRNSGSTCGTGSSDDSDRCWDGLSIGAQTIVARSSANHPAGTETTLNFRAEVGSQARQLAGTYVATTTITVLAL
ncbi:hypothetical protein GVX82_04015 [Patescibacteria group bacterium]|jgi:hypothetical protein|nr:hypothetical protein [Patescibacteria group bacterium]